MKKLKRIALLGQPNSGKSTIFNSLTGSHQHVGNWPGKTVEKIEGELTYNGNTYSLADLPGTYSLSANSDEEIITRDYIAKGNADLVLILADASQLERSLFMLADFAGINIPSMLVLTMIDVANSQGKHIDTKKLSDKLGIPVVSLVAHDKKGYREFYSTMENALSSPAQLSFKPIEALLESGESRDSFSEAMSLVPDKGIDRYSPQWLAVKLMEGDSQVAEIVFAADNKAKINSYIDKNTEGSLYTSDCKFEWIGGLLSDTVTRDKSQSVILTKFDRIAISKTWGRFVAIGIVLLGLVASMIAAAPIMALGGVVPMLLNPLIYNIGLPDILSSFISNTIVTAIVWVLSMSGFVFGVNLVFGIIEEVGYMARISYVFDNTMNKLGLQGKSIMPMLISFGCTIGGAAGTRVIDSWGQRILTIALAWAVPCAATFAVIPTFAGVVFGSKGAILVMLLLFGIMFIHIPITAKIFGSTLNPVNARTGLIMELPPYHKPRWKNIFKITLVRVWEVFKKVFVIVVIVASVFWALTYSATGDLSNSALYKFGNAISPVTQFFGMGWQTFLAFLSSMLSKEAVLGVTSVLFAGSGSIFAAATSKGVAVDMGSVIANSISKPEALAFMVAVTFNVPCLMALVATYSETHSAKWTIKIALYYIFTALLLSCLTYHISGLFF